MISLTMRINGGEQLEKRLEGMARRSTDMRIPFMQIDKTISLMFQRQFASNGAFGGGRWAPLRPATIADKARVNRAGMGILRRSNRLWRSLVAPGSPNSICVIDRQRYERGTSLPHARFHQNGFVVSKWGQSVLSRPTRVAPRPLWPDPLPRHMVQTWVRLIEKHIASPLPTSTPGFDRL